MSMCGYLASGIRFLVITAGFSLVVGFVVGILTIRKRDVKIPIVVAIGVFLSLNFGCCYYWFWCESDFECARGIGDTFRIPVKYPYEIVAIDHLGDGCLDSWEETDSYIVCGITDYATHFSIMVGKVEDPFTSMGYSDSEEWFSFNMDTGELICYSSQRAFIDACKRLGFAGMPRLRSLSEHYGDLDFPLDSLDWVFDPYQ
jgi:hypothetical protein